MPVSGVRQPDFHLLEHPVLLCHFALQLLTFRQAHPAALTEI
jgi:hypothetical protein